GLPDAPEAPAGGPVQARVPARHRGLRGQRARELLVARRAPLHRALDRPARPEARREVGLAVDQLQGAYRLAFGRAHRHHEHRARAIAGLFVERAVDVKRRAGRRAVGILEVEDGARQGHLSPHALPGEWWAHRRERNVDGVVLSEDESQVARAVALFLDQVERAGVALRDLARPAQDGLDEVSRVALGREPDADLIQLGQLALEPRRLGRAVEAGEG